MSPTYKSGYPEGTTFEEEYADGLLGAWETTFSKQILADAFAGSWEKRERSRAPYVDAWELKNAGISLFASPSLSHCCCEISGSGCERLINSGQMESIINAVSDRITRIDIACDIETDTSPVVFVEKLTHERMRASGTQISETGVTCYVGSQKSDRYARVYRYAEPHPRAHLLRVEHVFRKDYAKSVALACVSGDLQAVAEAAGRAFGWMHRDWDTGATNVVDISIVSPSRKAGNTVHWLIDSCAPAFKRLVESGDIRDPVEFLRRYFETDYSPHD